MQRKFRVMFVLRAIQHAVQQFGGRLVTATRRILEVNNVVLAIGLFASAVAIVIGRSLFAVPAAEHSWLLEGVVALEPLRLALFGYWLNLWAVWAIAIVASGRFLAKFRL